MGNCCGKEKGAFQGEGRTLNAAPASAPPAANGGRSTVPKVSGPGRTLGSNSAGSEGPASPSAAAARAAEARVNSPQPKGKLGKQLDARKAQTHNEALSQTARDNLAARNADANAQARHYN